RRAGTVRPAHGGVGRPPVAGRQSPPPGPAPSSRGPLGDAPSASWRAPGPRAKPSSRTGHRQLPFRREQAAGLTPALEGATDMNPYEPFSEAVREDPYPYYAALRDEAPVYWAQEAQAWCVSRYDDVLFVLRNPELFSSDAMRTMLMGARPGVNPLEDPAAMTRALALTEALSFPLDELMGARQLLSEDPPRHTEMRNLVNRGFTPRRIAM